MSSDIGRSTPTHSSPSSGDAAASFDDEPAPIAARTTLTYASGSFGSGIFFAFNNFILPLFLAPLGASAVLIGLLGSTRSVEGAVVQPLIGAWSDRTWTRTGRRRPFILAMVPISAVFLVLTPFGSSLAGVGQRFGWSAQLTILVLAALGIFIFSLTFNIMYDPYVALLADITPSRQRGTVNGVSQALGAFGQVAILLTAVFLRVSLTPLFILTAATMVVFFVPTVLGIREPRHLPGSALHPRYTWHDYWEGLRRDHQVQLYFAVQFFLWFGINAITPFLTLYAINAAHFSTTQALILSFILLLSTTIFVWPLGILGDRVGLKRVFLFGMMLMAGASIAGIFTFNPLLLYIILAIAGIGNAAQTASSYPLLTRLVFGNEIGLYTGLNTAVTSIAAPLSAALAGLIIDHVGYGAMFPFVATMFLLSLVPLSFLRTERSLAARARAASAAPMAR